MLFYEILLLSLNNISSKNFTYINLIKLNFTYINLIKLNYTN